ncbi:hypothetical protein IFM89_037200 [Coptis chinensis]|uniref:DNA-directed RNA polymerase n=1 Tax=Coptis chinensis TaxID=261450 RepID=A0A835HJE8_9MAGN|nr:hypothetical protein IFM89_037200 [Coptis chinensis]
MDGDVVEQQVPSALVTHLKFGLLTAADIEKISVLPVNVGTDITNAKLGLPNEASECSTCGAKSAKDCDGHLGMLTLPKDICHPYNLSVIVKILNSICPSCKSNKKESRNKGSGRKPKMSNIASHQPMGCKYCAKYDMAKKQESSKKWYPQVKFKVSSRNSSGEIGSAIAVEVKVPKKLNDILPDGFWNFIEEDPDEEEISLNPSIRYLSPYQVYSLLKDIDPTMIVKLAPRLESLFLGCLPVTSNCSRVMEFSNGKKLVFDERTKAYKRLIDFKGQASELALRVRDFLSVSKASKHLYTEKSSNTDVLSGLKWVKDVVLAKRTDNSFRMVVVGDPNVKLGEIGMPREICQKLIFPETLNEQNWEKLHDCCRLSILERGQFRARRKDDTIVLRNEDDLKIGDIVYRHLDEGDLLLLNRPPSIHQHSLIALSVRVLPMDSVVLLNPICCSPFRGDFDGDCFHGYIPQSIKSRVELQELVCIDRQLVNGQNGRNLISLCHDSLSAAHLLREKGEFLNKVEMQQLGMLCSRQLPYPAIVRATDHNPIWTGNQLLSMLLPVSFDYSSLSGVHISNGEIISAPGSSWLQDTDGNLFISLVKLYGSKAVDIIFTIQEVLLEWISMRGFSVSLSDLFVSCDSYTWDKMTEEVRSGLQEAKKGLKNVLSKHENADVPGTLNRKLMFSMRDLYMAYDGTVRYSYGNQVVQFSYGVSEDSSVLTSGNSAHQLGDPVGSLAACSISEAAYSALEKPISTFESSPLLNLKMLLDSSYKKTTVGQTVSLFLSKKLERWLYGPEYGALTVRSHLERVLFSDIVSSVMIIFSQQRSCRPHTSPWVCHFHLHQGKMKKIGLDVQSIINALHQECDSTRQTLKVELPKLHILTRICSATNAQNEKDEDICITVEAEVSRSSLLVMDTFRHTVIPFLLGTVIKGIKVELDGKWWLQGMIVAGCGIAFDFVAKNKEVVLVTQITKVERTNPCIVGSTSVAWGVAGLSIGQVGVIS